MISFTCSKIVTVLGFFIFLCVVLLGPAQGQKPILKERPDRVVVSAPVLILLHGGDRFLAANLEAIRLTATGIDERGVDSGYLVRAQYEIARLNACHEDNYYLANGLLTWGGAVVEGNRVLEAAVICRTWDFVPAFFLGVNLAFFNQDKSRASEVLDIAAGRSVVNSPALRKLAIVLRAESLADERLARGYLVNQRDSAADPRLREMLNKRVVRLDGLLLLRSAQRKYESLYGPLQRLEQLLERRVLKAIPDDPLRLGYEVDGGKVVLKKIKIIGLEGGG